LGLYIKEYNSHAENPPKQTKIISTTANAFFQEDEAFFLERFLAI
jgi:hypothetical protein